MTLKIVNYISQRCVLCLCLLTALAAPVFVSAATQKDQVVAFSYIKNTTEGKIRSADTRSTEELNDEVLSVRTWSVKPSTKLSSLLLGDSFTITLPKDKSVSVRVTMRKKLDNGDVQITGSFLDNGNAVFTIGSNRIYASIINDSMNYSLGADELGQARLVDKQTIPHRKESLEKDFRLPSESKWFLPKKSANSMQTLKLEAARSSAKSDIDILVVYSAEFAALFSSPVTRINQLIGFSNAAYDRSGILINLRLAGAVQINFNNAQNIGVTLDQSTEGQGAFSNLPQLRNQYKADLVAVLSGGTNFGASGVAWISGDSARIAFSSTRLSAGCCDAVFTHELGHNMGSGHEHVAVNPNQRSPCRNSFTGFSCGHGNRSAGWGTIMSYLDDRAVGFRFSNLDSDCLGQPCGIAQGRANAADNRTSFNMSRLLIADFRQADDVVPDPDPDPDPIPDPDPDPDPIPDPIPDPDPVKPNNVSFARFIPILDLLLSED